MKTSVAIILFVFIVIWQFIVTGCAIPEYILPSPVAVAQASWHFKQLLATESIPTIVETLTGLSVGILIACVTAISLTYFKHASKWFLPFLIASQAIPTFTIAPLLVLWFGYGLASKIIVTVIMIFFPITSNFYDGLQKTPVAYLDIASTMNASAWQTLLKIQIPSALPSLGAGIRVAATIAPIGAIVGEWVGASQGLGFLMLNANARLQTSLMFSALILIIIMSLSLYYSLDKFVNRKIFWKT